MSKDTNSTLLWMAGAGLALAVRSTLRSSRAMDLAGKVALITGGSRGLGLVLARQLAEQGMRLAICARDEEELERAREELASTTEVIAIPCDVGDRPQVQRLVDDVLERLGGLDAVINNAGVITVGPMEEMTIEDYELAMRTHYWGPLHVCLAVLPHMKKRRQGRIVNISSIGGKVSVPHLLPYSGSKSALVGLSQGLRAELLKDGIYVTTVAPGLMRTGSPRNALFAGQHQQEYIWFSAGDSLPGISISAEEAARQIVEAMRYGDSELTISLPAQIGALVNGMFPGLTADLLGLVNQMLPGPGGIGQEKRSGKESGSSLAPSLLTTLTDEAARQNNEVPPEELAAQKAGAIP